MIETIIREYRALLTYEWEPDESQLFTLSQLVRFSLEKGFAINTDYETAFTEAVNQKLNLNSQVYRNILNEAFAERIKLNYIMKTKIRSLLDSADRAAYEKYLDLNNIRSKGMMNVYNPVGKEVTMEALTAVFNTDKNNNDVFNSIFSRFCFNLFEKKCTSLFFSGDEYDSDDFFGFIVDKYPDMCDRNSALGFIDVSEDLFSLSYKDGCNRVLEAVRYSYQKLNNHCELVVYIPPIKRDGQDYQWLLYSDVILYAEKHIKEKIDKAYFRWQKIGTKTCEYIKRIVPYSAEFEYAFQGFAFKDCFVLRNGSEYSLLLVFEKNVRDERPVNCPACHTSNIQGNSYPILNVRSWECENPLCPDRSKYNRGKRYAFMSLFRQKQMLDEDNLIPESSISKWHLDCLEEITKKDAFDMAVMHYSCVNDGVFVFTVDKNGNAFLDEAGRMVSFLTFSDPHVDIITDFKNSTYFYRYLQTNQTQADSESANEWTSGKAKVICGDSFYVLKTIPAEYFDGAVTSPPYYNAKSYSQWSNIYCYLYDMFNIAKEVYRVLKDGAVYLYNIFDYFDNENNIVLSAMGNKRMILGAYMIDMFRRIGFEIRGNIVWNKGEIQGNRSFNQGNLTPYYQAPLNCWEHVIILSKGKPNKKYKDLISSVHNIQPVIKIIHGKNVLGHDAPYPKEIPELLIKHMRPLDTVLDPFLGSGTTSIVANEYGINSIGIEKNAEYYSLCQTLIKK